MNKIGKIVMVVWLLAVSPSLLAQEASKIAFIGRYEDPTGNSGSNEWYDTFAEKSLRAFIEDLNRRRNTKYTLEVFNIQHSPAKADSVYQLIARDPSFLLVFDNSWGHDMAGAQKTIIANKIPVISINAYRGYLDYGEHVLFLLDYKSDFRYVAGYAKKILQQDSVIFISENDVVFDQQFLDVFNELDLNIKEHITYKGQQNINPSDSIALFSKLDQHIKEKDSGQVVIYNSHFMWGNAVISYLNSRLKNSKFLSWSVPQDEYVRQLKNGNQLIIHHKSPYDVPEPVYLIYRKLFKEYPDYFIWKGASGLMEDLKQAVDIVELFTLKQSNTALINKETMAAYLSGIKDKETAGFNNIFRFNEEQQLIRENNFTIYEGGGLFYPANQQLNAEMEVLETLTIGFDMKDIYDINFESTSFNADLEFWIMGDQKLEFLADRLVRYENLRSPDESIYPYTSVYENGKFYRKYNVSGSFYNFFDGASYPFDKQKLDIQIALLNPDSIRLFISPKTYDERVDQLKISGWNSEDYYVTLEKRIESNVFSKKKDFETQSFINIHFVAERKIWSSILVIIIPLFFIGAITIAILFLETLNFGHLGEVIVGLFLSIIAFSFSMGDISPSFDSLSIADILFMITFILVFMVFIFLILLNSKYRTKYEKKIVPFRTFLLIAYPIIFIMVSIIGASS